MRRAVIILSIAALASVMAFAGHVTAHLRRGGPARIVIASDVVGVRAGPSYAYILYRNNRVVLIDAGGDPSGAAIRAELQRLGLAERHVEAVLLTHGHRDHYAAASLFENATVYVSPADHLLVRGRRAPRGLVSKLAQRLLGRPPLQRRIGTVLPGAMVHAGGRVFEVIATPGHTPGSLMYRHRDLLFTGDSMQIDGDHVIPAPWFTSANSRDTIRALARLRTVDFVAIADGHAGFAPDGRSRFDRWLEAQKP